MHYDYDCDTDQLALVSLNTARTIPSRSMNALLSLG
jgi:hypothetical protein